VGTAHQRSPASHINPSPGSLLDTHQPPNPSARTSFHLTTNQTCDHSTDRSFDHTTLSHERATTTTDHSRAAPSTRHHLANHARGAASRAAPARFILIRATKKNLLTIRAPRAASHAINTPPQLASRPQAPSAHHQKTRENTLFSRAQCAASSARRAAKARFNTRATCSMFLLKQRVFRRFSSKIGLHLSSNCLGFRPMQTVRGWSRCQPRGCSKRTRITSNSNRTVAEGTERSVAYNPLDTVAKSGGRIRSSNELPQTILPGASGSHVATLALRGGTYGGQESSSEESSSEEAGSEEGSGQEEEVIGLALAVDVALSVSIAVLSTCRWQQRTTTEAVGFSRPPLFILWLPFWPPSRSGNREISAKREPAPQIPPQSNAGGPGTYCPDRAATRSRHPAAPTPQTPRRRHPSPPSLHPSANPPPIHACVLLTFDFCLLTWRSPLPHHHPLPSTRLSHAHHQRCPQREPPVIMMHAIRHMIDPQPSTRRLS
jgi:hypothetical protein